MEKIQWNDSFSIGHAEIDAEHQMLVNTIAALQASLSDGIVNPQVGVALKELVHYTQTHFTHEENEKREAAYPEYPAHKKLHGEITKKVVKLLCDLKRGDSVNAIQLIGLAKDWLTDHILVHDKKLGLYLKEREKSSTQS